MSDSVELFRRAIVCVCVFEFGWTGVLNRMWQAAAAAAAATTESRLVIQFRKRKDKFEARENVRKGRRQQLLSVRCRFRSHYVVHICFHCKRRASRHCQCVRCTSDDDDACICFAQARKIKSNASTSSVCHFCSGCHQIYYFLLLWNDDIRNKSNS